jgi:phosphoglycolate phosphatase-like HAD superfamily hydrolase
MQAIRAVLFEPVGCLAEFSAGEFNEVAANVFDLPGDPGQSGSEAYWELLDLMQSAADPLTAEQMRRIESLELQAVERAHLYEDVGSALAELKGMGITLLIASSLSAAAVGRFVEKFSLGDFFTGVWTRDNAGGVKTAPLARAIEGGSFHPAHVMSLCDTAGGLSVAKEVGANAILMFNDYDEGKRLAAHAPAGAIVSLHELPDAIRFVAEGAKRG